MPYRVLARKMGILLAVTAMLVVAPRARAQDPKTDLENKLDAQYALTKTTADRSDIVTAGAVVKLDKDGLLMTTASTQAPPTSTYKDGKISMGMGAQITWRLLLPPGSSLNSVPQRKFVTGENVWVTAHKVNNDGVVFQFYSDPINNDRYYGQLKFPFNKKSVPPADEMMKTIAEVLTVDSSAAAAPAAPAAAAAPAAPPAPLAPIAPPPPPPDEAPPPPKTIAIGQTKDQVVAIFGQPQKVVKLRTKEIDYFPDMKVTFTDGKVSDIR